LRVSGSSVFAAIFAQRSLNFFLRKFINLISNTGFAVEYKIDDAAVADVYDTVSRLGCTESNGGVSSG
jgi:hypothetical protein